MITTYRARRRHAHLRDIAERLVNRAGRSRSDEITCEQLAAMAFGRNRLHVEPDEAAEYLAAALAEFGYGIDHLQRKEK
ncbi:MULTISPECIES: hypothetical protein [unclassified Streptomyces]|uniref:hypothetical protein n=1 Tax=unclassified Streptomyces TaxID=2593676 RepID=UPI00380B1D84